MDYQEFMDKLKDEGIVKYPKFASDPSWPYVNPAPFVRAINASTYTYEQVRDAFWKALDLFGGDAYSAFARSHDGGSSVFYFLKSKNENQLIKPIPPDTNYAPISNEIQTQFMNNGLNMYGKPFTGPQLNDGPAKWAAFASNPPYNAFDVKLDTAKWLLLNVDFVSPGSSRDVWAKFANKDIAEACYIIESEFNHPGVV